MKIEIFIVGSKLKDFFSINKQVNIATIIKQNETKLKVCLANINTKLFLW